jgi:tight adherence protein B
LTLTVARRRRLAPVLLVCLTAVVLSHGGALPHIIAACTAIGVAAFSLRLHLRGREGKRRRERGREVAEAIDVLAAELGAGVLATHAVQHLAEDAPLLGPAAAACRLGGDVAAAFRASARLPGAESLEELAAAWEVSERSGAPMARVLDRLGEGLRDERDAQREVQAGLGPAKATARLMAVLPLFGLVMGMNMGSDPVHVLLDTLPGSMCLSAGAALACAGVNWVDRIATRAEGR